jgi:rSAM/selenodomain-associated transferase 1
VRPARVVVFARAPELGRVKTRLAASVGDARACAVYTQLGARVVASLVVDDGRAYDVRVCFTPRDREAAVRAWVPGADAYVPQCEGDLGARLRGEVDAAFDDGCEAVVLVGTDCLAVNDARVCEALDALAGGDDAALGPALDGGYYLLAMARRMRLFEGVPWSTDAVAEATRTRLRAAGARWRELPAERDVDTREDLDALGDLLGA